MTKSTLTAYDAEILISRFNGTTDEQPGIYPSELFDVVSYMIANKAVPVDDEIWGNIVLEAVTGGVIDMEGNFLVNIEEIRSEDFAMGTFKRGPGIPQN